jgi:hypothetical protein
MGALTRRLLVLASVPAAVAIALASRDVPARAESGAPALARPAPTLPIVQVDGQPLAANIRRVIEALDYAGAPLAADLKAALGRAGQARDAAALQALIDAHVLLAVHVNPEARVKVSRGPAPARLQQAGYTPVLVKVVNESGGTQQLRIGSPQAGPVYAGMSALSAERMQQPHLRVNENVERRTDRFLDLEMMTAPPMTPTLSGLDVEYAVALIHSSEAGRREATITFDVGEGTQDLGFRAEVPVLFDVRPAVAVMLRVRDHDGTPTTGRFQFVDRQGHVFPPQVKRLAPDLFFQKHVYRADGETVLLPPGELVMAFGRGPEYRWKEQAVVVPAPGASGRAPEIAVVLERWIHPALLGFFSGDHHVHASGCAHYTSPAAGVDPAVMFRQVKGEGLNVGSVLTWGPGFDHQQQFFAPSADRHSEPLTQMKYDIEVSGFGSQALGHVVLLNLKAQIYPGATGSKGWPSWTLPVLRWAKAQGGVTGYAHSGSGLQINARRRRRRPAERHGSRGGSAARALRHDGCRSRRLARRGRAAIEPRSGGARAAEPRDSGAEQRRRAGDLRHGGAWRGRFHQRHGHGPHQRVERLVSPDECRPAREGERRNRLPVHERHPRRTGAELRSARHGPAD